jgi:hypothetical protein
VYGFIFGNILVELVRILGRAVLNACCTACAQVLFDISGFTVQGNMEITSLTLDVIYLSVSQYLYVRMPADLDQFRGEYSHGAVVGRKGLIQLGHMAADTGRPFHQIDLKTCRGEVQRGLNAADTAADDHNIAVIACLNAFN